jgi:S-adenosylmethionine:tRNA ribosyltransferase-isomerase
MKLKDLSYDFPESLIATEPSRPTRVMWVQDEVSPIELNLQELLLRIPAGDVLVINNTKVLKRRVFAENEIEILFLDEIEKTAQHNTWKVLFPSKRLALGDTLKFGEFTLKLLEKGRPQIVQITPAITEKDFEKIAELPLPPYIQKARQERHNVNEDQAWYQTAWAEIPGSMAAPTASLHFSQQDLMALKARGVRVIELTLHVGLGTFLPVTTDDLDQHQMHSETYEISAANWAQILDAKKKSQKIWALGTTTTRVLESVFRTQKLAGQTDILLQVGSSFHVVDRLLTNFHQFESTLLALVVGFLGFL